MGAQGSPHPHQRPGHHDSGGTCARDVDPTGSGDAYRAGLVLSLLRGLDPETAGRVAALAGTYAVEVDGTQTQRYTLAEFSRRYEEAWGTPAPLTEVAA